MRNLRSENFRKFLPVFFSGLLLIMTCVPSSAQTTKKPANFPACEDDSEILMGDKVLQNNVWKRDTGGVQCVFPGLFSGFPVAGTEEYESEQVVASWMWNW